MTALHRSLRVAEVEPFSPHDLAASCDHHRYAALLENPGTPSELGRYAYFCTDPFWVFRSKRGRCWSGPPDAVAEVDRAPLDELARLLERDRAGVRLRPTTGDDPLPPFVGGAVGYLGYELLYLIEDIPDLGRDDLELPDAYLLFCKLVYASDRLTGRSWVFATGLGHTPEAAADEAQTLLDEGRARVASLDPARSRERGVADLRALAAAARDREPRLLEAHLHARGITPTIDRAGYLDSIEHIKQQILCGNAFEVCLTQRFDLRLPTRVRELYEVLRAINPAPMSAYLRFPEAELLSASPERFVSLDRAGVVETRPIKGTRPRGRSPAEDQALRDDLLGAAKDRAENLMIVDLCRNDLGKVCEFGSVRVDELCSVQPYEFTWQMVSTIHGQLRAGLGPVELLRACFPGGSMTGAPKIEAMKIIDRLEPTKRGVFSGAIGYFDFDGSLDLSIVIRTLIKTGELLTFNVGGAIVADSDPDEEYQETLDKAHALVLAIDLVRAEAHARGDR
ncbi:Para-aminobenzoate synthase, amidotransferase component [Enhygromyxa salina]|uniref:aminodeoxychorismate synthase n=1 Tax=Enhygromyxa salina TaxID=215803 RepID=A0A0C1ZB17_9BACT|nr:aminodeoxychorismate synthase component I [Enhygromyxa salina]KIG14854.1 Para-aminobenzoate synthase, amidotransferase component [Enhygromyxa salina]